MEIFPILASLRKHKIPAILIVLEIALACAVFCNAVFMISQRIATIHLPNAIAEGSISSIRAQGTDPKQASANIPRDLAALRKIPGVRAAAMINSLPLSHNAFNSGVASKPDQVAGKNQVNAANYMLTNGGAKALGLHLLSGRFFRGDEYATSKIGKNFTPTAHVVLVTQSLAQRLWPGQSVLGKQLWTGNSSFTVVGVVADVLRPSRNGLGNAGFHWAVFFPISAVPLMAEYGQYVVRSTPGSQARVVREGVKKLRSLSPNAVVKGKTFASMRNQFFDSTRSMIWMLVLVCVVMLAVTAFGIVGLTSFWVRQRRRQIGIRRAVGATRGHIMQYFQTENFLLSTAGVAFGAALAFGINLYLMQHYQLDRMPAYYLPASAIALWILGQLAVLGPALRASNVPPVVATRNV